jgi:release factor glutamine methyltransferase
MIPPNSTLGNARTTIAYLLKNAQETLAESSILSPRLDCEILLSSLMGVDRSYLIAHNDEFVRTGTIDKFNYMVMRRLKREPIAYIVGSKEFYGRNFIVTPNVLIPRPETEQIIDFVKNAPLSKSILDVGTGSGAIAITLDLEIQSAKITASDISDKALAAAKENAAMLNSEINFNKSDLLTNIDDKFDIIVANLPYVDPEWETSPETIYEPKIALFADDAGLDLIKKLISQSKNNLSPKGIIVLEMDTRQINAIIEFAKNHGFDPIEKQPFLLALQIQ